MTRAEELAATVRPVVAHSKPAWDALAAIVADAEQYRIEADKGLHDYDDLELRAEALAEALERIAERRAFAPSDRNYIGASPSIARAALARYRGEKHG